MKRILLLLFSQFIKTDNLSFKYPVSVKAKVIDSGRILIVKNERGEWDFPGGKIESDDSVEITVIKEIKEEFGIDISVKNLLYCQNNIVNEVNVMIVVFETVIICNNPINLSFENFNYLFVEESELKNYKLSNWLSKSDLI